MDDRMTELQNDRMTDRTKTLCLPIFDLGGIKMKKIHIKVRFNQYYINLKLCQLKNNIVNVALRFGTNHRYNDRARGSRSICDFTRSILYNYWILMRLTWWFINPGDLTFTEANSRFIKYIQTQPVHVGHVI